MAQPQSGLQRLNDLVTTLRHSGLAQNTYPIVLGSVISGHIA